MPRRVSLVLLLLLVSVCGMGRAQDFDFQTQREPVISLDGKWRFHAGDDPRWADPNFDDSHWSLSRSDAYWGKQGYAQRIGWYRFRVRDLGEQPLAILLTYITESFQVFANGKLIGQFGRFPPHPKSYVAGWTIFPLPQARSSSNLTVALRVYTSAPGFGGPYRPGSLLGRTDLLNSRRRTESIGAVWGRLDGIIVAILEVIAGLTALSLYFIDTSKTEYLWYALARLCNCHTKWIFTYGSEAAISVNAIFLFWASFTLLAQLFDLLFFCRILQGRRNWLFWCALVGLNLVFLLNLSVVFLHFSLVIQFVADLLTSLFFYVFLIQIAWRGVRLRLLDAGFLFFPVLLDSVTGIIYSANSYLPAFGLRIPGVLMPFTYGLSFGLLTVKPKSVTELLLLLAVLSILLVRFARTRRDEEDHLRELESARTVQKVLVPEDIPSVPGFSIASIYRPAQQVGGDFFQVIPVPNGVLIAIGDVSGKGLPAAMTVSLLVGTLRTLAEQTESPAAILQGLNRRLVGRSRGFTTCLVAHLGPDGESLIANAGHLPPYRNGEEVQIAPELPLGLSSDARYFDSPLSLQPNDSLTFISDGVVEAKNAKGELFGFERTRQNSTQSADAIAAAAKQFGQQDDITVLTVAFQPVLAAC